jgi:hypothetical protein
MSLRPSPIAWMTCLVLSLASLARAEDPWASYAGKEGPGKGKNVVLIAGDEEYRSEEALPMLAQILAERHGFNCTVLFAIDPATGKINPNELHNVPGMDKLDTADLVIIQTRFRELPDGDMKHFVDYVNSGKPIIGLRTATHAFNYAKGSTSAYSKYSYNAKDWPGGFGKQVLGETWVSHHGSHAKEATRGVINQEMKDHPVLRGVRKLFGLTDVYGIRQLPEDAKVLVNGQVLKGMSPDDPPVEGPKNNPMQPVTWIREAYPTESGKPARILCSTLASAIDFENRDLRRLIVNGVYWGVGLEDKIPAEGTDVKLVGEYHPSGFHFFEPKKMLEKMPKPSDLKLGAPVGQNDRTFPGGKPAPEPKELN